MELCLSNFNELSYDDCLMVDGGGVVDAIIIVGGCTIAGGAAGALAGAAAGYTVGNAPGAAVGGVVGYCAGCVTGAAVGVQVYKSVF